MDTSTVLYNTDTSLLRTVRLVPEMPKIITYIPYLYNTDTSVKRALGYVLLVSVLKSFDCTYLHVQINSQSLKKTCLCMYFSLTLRLLLIREIMLRHIDSRINVQLKFNTIAAPRAKGSPP